MTLIQKSFVGCDELLDAWQHDVLYGEPPRRYNIGEGLDHIRLGPGTVAILGGSPGMGKTAFAMQCVVTAMINDPTLRVCVANVEMPPLRLLERQLSRLSHVSLDSIQNRTVDDLDHGQINKVFEMFQGLASRLTFVLAPFSMSNITAAMEEFEAELIVVDYIQRIRSIGTHNDKRGAIDETMGILRDFSNEGHCVLALSAVGRSKNAQGQSSYASEGLSLASFRESSELEYGADDAYLLVGKNGSYDATGSIVDVTLKQLKSRYGRPTNCDMVFDRAYQSFEVTHFSSRREALSNYIGA